METSKNGLTATRKKPCPICRKPDYCLLFPDGGVNCYRVRNELEKTDGEGSTYWVYPPDQKREFVPVEPDRCKVAIAEPGQVDRAYRELQHQLTLSKAHEEQLIARGLSPTALRSHGFVSVPSSAAVRATVAESVARLFPFWESVPGFFSSKAGKARLAASQGLLIFGQDLDGLCNGVKIRLDDASKGDSRYVWLSSAKHGGASAGAPPSFWKPVSSPTTAGVVRLAEGAFKALVSAEFTGVPGIASGSGVGGMASPKVLAWLEELTPHTVLFTPDQDAHEKPEVTARVRSALGRVVSAGQRLGFGVEVEVWQTHITPADRLKGVDDCLAAGVELERVPAEAYLASLPGGPIEQVGESEPPAAPEVQSQTLEAALKASLAFCDQMKPKDVGNLATMVDAASRGVQLAPKARKKALAVLQRYESQLAKSGINIHDVVGHEQALRESEGDDSHKDPGNQADMLLESAAAAQLLKQGSHHYMSTRRTNPDGSFSLETVRFNDRGNGVAAWLTYNFYKAKGRAPSSEAIKAALSTLEARCEFEGRQETVWLRAAEVKSENDRSDTDRRLFHDLGDDHRKVVVVSAEGWQVTQDVPVFFWRPKTMMPIPEPVRGGSIEELRQFVNLPDENSWILVVSFLLYCFVPTTPHPLLMLEGEEGSCKTWLGRLLRLLVDPNGALTRRPPRNEEDLSLYALNSHLPCIDNISGIEEWLSDGLCAISTGNGWGRRQKFTDEAESVVSVVRPVIMTGLGGLHGKSDLMDRTIKIIMQRIPPGKRQAESDLGKAFEEARPRILGAIYSILSVGLANRGKVDLPELPRMADFARFICECEPGLPWKQGQFLEAFKAHRVDQVLSVLESDGLADAVRNLMSLQTRWEGTATQLHDRLSEFRNIRGKLPSPLKMKPSILKLRPSLRYLGIEVSERRTTNSRLLLLEKGCHKPAVLSQAENGSEETPPNQGSSPVTAYDSKDDSSTLNDSRTSAAEVRAAGKLF